MPEIEHEDFDIIGYVHIGELRHPIVGVLFDQNKAGEKCIDLKYLRHIKYSYLQTYLPSYNMKPQWMEEYVGVCKETNLSPADYVLLLDLKKFQPNDLVGYHDMISFLSNKQLYGAYDKMLLTLSGTKDEP